LNFNRRRRIWCLVFAATTIVAGLTWRLIPLGLPPFWFKYGGSALWAMAVYWVVAAALPKWRPGSAAVLACFVALIVEFSRLLHTPWLDSFRISLAGRLLLGRFFAVQNIVAYWIAIGLVATADHFTTHKRQP
jgi:hypothetical protein